MTYIEDWLSPLNDVLSYDPLPCRRWDGFFSSFEWRLMKTIDVSTMCRQKSRWNVAIRFESELHQLSTKFRRNFLSTSIVDCIAFELRRQLSTRHCFEPSVEFSGRFHSYNGLSVYTNWPPVSPGLRHDLFQCERPPRSKDLYTILLKFWDHTSKHCSKRNKLFFDTSNKPQISNVPLYWFR